MINLTPINSLPSELIVYVISGWFIQLASVLTLSFNLQDMTSCAECEPANILLGTRRRTERTA